MDTTVSDIVVNISVTANSGSKLRIEGAGNRLRAAVSSFGHLSCGEEKVKL